MTMSPDTRAAIREARMHTRILLITILAMGLGLAGLMARGFGWL